MVPDKKTVTLVVTEHCNFACKYCYLVHKNQRHRMSFSVARAAVDYLLENRELFSEPSVIWDFIGGEPLIEIELITRIIEYIRQRAYELQHPWFSNSWFGMSSNGLLYRTDQVQQLLKTHGNQVEIGITLDGPRHVHDRQRVFPDGRGTYDKVVANVPLWLKQHPKASTKVTLAHDTLPFVAESVLNLFSLGIKTVNANVVFENDWQDGDDEIFEQQLDLLGEAMIANDLWRDHNCSLFSEFVGKPLDPSNDGNWCGAGMMLAVDTEGTFYPCVRFTPFSLSKRQARTIGNIRDGIDLNRIRPFLALTRSSQSTSECFHCQVASGCAWCQGFNYDDADTPTIYQRATHICSMHRARARANRRYWAKIEQLKEQRGER